MQHLIPSEIQKLWTLLPHPPHTFVRWFARNGQDRIGGGVDTVEELMWAAASAQGMNFYVAPNPACTRAGTRHRAEHVMRWSWFLIDVDPVEQVANPPCVIEQVLYKLGQWWSVDFGTRMPLQIYSGRGAQVWIRLPDYLLYDELEGKVAGMAFPLVGRRQARITNGYWLDRLAAEIGTSYGCRIDTTCKDLPRVMRCPGTVNVKTGSLACLIVPSEEVFELGPRLVAGVPGEMFIPVPVETLPAGTPWQSVLVHLTIRAQDYLTKGKDEPGRHDTMFHAALCLAERGLEREMVREALEYGNERWDVRHSIAAGDPNSMRLKPEDIEHALDTAFRRLNRAGQCVTLDVEGDSPPQPSTDEEASCS